MKTPKGHAMNEEVMKTESNTPGIPDGSQLAQSVEAVDKFAEADGFSAWWDALWAGSDDIPVPEYQSKEWDRYMAERTLVRGAWNEAWHQASALAHPRPTGDDHE